MKVQDPITDSDPLDGAKAVGCLFAGIIILIAILAIGYSVISNLRVP